MPPGGVAAAGALGLHGGGYVPAQRRLEREIRKSRRMEQAALSDDAKRTASERKRAYEKKLREHIKEHDLPRRRHREQIRKPGNPMPPA